MIDGGSKDGMLGMDGSDGSSGVGLLVGTSGVLGGVVVVDGVVVVCVVVVVVDGLSELEESLLEMMK